MAIIVWLAPALALPIAVSDIQQNRKRCTYPSQGVQPFTYDMANNGI